MAVTATNLAMGPGTLYVGTFGATEPADTAVALAAAPSAPFTDVGGTLGGLTFSVNQQFKELEVDQLVEVPERRVTRREASFKTQLAEVTLANLVIALNSGTITAGVSGAPDTFVPANTDSSGTPAYKAIIFDGAGAGGLRRRVIVRKVLSTDNVDASSSKDSQTVYPVTFTSHYVSSVIPSYKIIQASA
jgi:hypothetical protein